MGKYKVEICGVNTATLPVLKSQQMTELFIQLQDGDLSAKEKLINGNLKLVLSIVQRFAHRTENMDDLFQIGCIGLIKACLLYTSSSRSWPASAPLMMKITTR